MLGIYVFIILSIPVGAYLVSQSKIIKSNASEPKSSVVKATPRPKLAPINSSAKTLLKEAASDLLASNSTSTETASPTIATSFGPTLSLKVALDGRPADNQATKLFVGILEGTLSTNPKFLLSFSVDLPKDGTYSNLSLAGLNSGTQYTALLKGSAQIATSSAFVMSPTVSNLNTGETINLLSGDLNEDNVINSADYSIAQKANGATSTLSNWNDIADLNRDGVINAFDLAIITKNFGQTGASGAWTSPIPKVGTSSASLNTNHPVGAAGGYWMWIPK